jgi:dTDP-4-dehydrorhamnose reductase
VFTPVSEMPAARTTKIALIGASGQLGTDLATVLGETFTLRPLTHDQLDVTDQASIEQALAADTPDVLINTAAFNRVDDCELHPEVAFRVNTVGPHLLARACRRSGTRLIHFSTDYVFSGDMGRPWTELDCPRPTSMYGISKLGGELAARAADVTSYGIRVSGLFGLAGGSGKGGNFVETMLRLQAGGRPLRVVDDQVLAPTYTLDLALKMREFILAEPAAGLYHMTAEGACSWYEFARAIFALSNLEADLRPQSSADLGADAAPRPHFSVLANDALRATGISQIRHWSAGLSEYLRRRAARRNSPISPALATVSDARTPTTL